MAHPGGTVVPSAESRATGLLACVPVTRPIPTPATPSTAALAPVGEMLPGTRCVVERIGGYAADELAHEGILPGAEIRVAARTPLGGPFILEVGRSRIAVSACIASAVLATVLDGTEPAA